MTQINNMNKKRSYEKPSMKVYQLKNRKHLLVGSLPVDPEDSPYQW